MIESNDKSLAESVPTLIWPHEINSDSININGSPLSGYYTGSKGNDIYEGSGSVSAIDDLNLVDVGGDNSISAINHRIFLNEDRTYDSHTIRNSSITFGDGADKIIADINQGYYAHLLHESTVDTGSGDDIIKLTAIEGSHEWFVYAVRGVFLSTLNLGGGDDLFELDIFATQEETFATTGFDNTALNTGSGDDSVSIAI